MSTGCVRICNDVNIKVVKWPGNGEKSDCIMVCFGIFSLAALRPFVILKPAPQT